MFFAAGASGASAAVFSVISSATASAGAAASTDPLKSSCTPDDWYDAIVYIDNRVANSVTATNAIATGTLLGYTYDYAETALDMVTGNRVKVSVNTAIYNCKLQAGKFYMLHNGYVEDEVEVGGEFIKVAFLKYAKGNSTILVNEIVDQADETTPSENGEAIVAAYEYEDDGEYIVAGTKAMYCKLDNGNVTLEGGTGANKDEAKNFANGFEEMVPVYYYAKAEDCSMTQVVLSAPIAEGELPALTGLTENEANKLVEEIGELVAYIGIQGVTKDADGALVDFGGTYAKYATVAATLTAQVEEDTAAATKGQTYYNKDGEAVDATYKVVFYADVEGEYVVLDCDDGMLVFANITAVANS